MSGWAEVRRAPVRALAVLGLAGVALVLSSGSASAHAELESSNPANGAALATPPASVVLRFDEEITARYSTARLVDGTGDTVPGVVQRISADGRTLTLSLARASLPDGAYGVQWRNVAADDGHAETGALAFSVGLGAPSALPAVASSAAPARASVAPLDAARRALRILALSLVIGGLAVAAFVLPPTAVGPRRRVLRLVVSGALGGLTVGLADLMAERSQLSGGGIGDLLTQTRWGQLWLARQVALLVIAVLVLRRRRQAATLVGVLALAATEALGSHAASESGLAVAVLTVHVLAAATWVGALAALAILLWRGDRQTQGLKLLRDNRFRISWLLGTSVCLLVASGLYSAGWGVTRLTALTTTGYGETLVVKVGLVGVALALAALNSSRLHGLLRPLGGVTLGLEIAAVILVVGATGVLVESPPARTTAAPAAPIAAAARPASGGTSVGDLVVSLVVSPNQPGLNAFTVLATSSRRPDPGPVSGAVLHLDQAGATSTITLRENAPGQYFGTGTLAATNPSGPSPIGVTIDVQRSADTIHVRLPWSVAPTPKPSPVPAPPPEPRHTAPYADGLAVLVLALGAAAAGWAARRRRPSPTDAPGAGQPVLERSL